MLEICLPDVIFSIFLKLSSFFNSDDNYLSYLTRKKCAFLDIFWSFFKNYSSDLDKLDIFVKYRSNYVYIAYSQLLQIPCVAVDIASMYNFLKPPYNMFLLSVQHASFCVYKSM